MTRLCVSCYQSFKIFTFILLLFSDKAFIVETTYRYNSPIKSLCRSTTKREKNSRYVCHILFSLLRRSWVFKCGAVKMKYISLMSALMLLVIGSSVKAEETLFGWLPTISSISVDDPDGPTDNSLQIQPISIFLSHELDRNSRVLTTFANKSYDLDYGPNDIYQEIDVNKLAVTYQRRINVSRANRFWIGGGMFFGKATYDNRTVVLPNGDNCQGQNDECIRLADRDETEYGFIFNFATTPKMLNRYWGVAAYADYSQTFSNGFSEGSVGVMFTYKAGKP